MAVQRKDYSGYDLKVRSLDVIEDINSPQISNVTATLNQAQSRLKSVDEALTSLIAALGDDGVITPAEKLVVKTEWHKWYNADNVYEPMPIATINVAGKYKTTADQAMSVGVWAPTQEGTKAKAFYDAAEALRRYLYDTPGVLKGDTWANYISIGERTTWLSLWADLETMAQELLSEVEYKNSHRESDASVFFERPLGPYKKGDLWIDNGILYQAKIGRGAGEFYEDDWEWCIRSNLTTVIESTNGDVFKPGENTTTTLIPHCFRNGIEITDTLPDSAFKWTRVSRFPQSPPNDDDTWNFNHASGYRTVEVTTNSIYARATYKVEILE